MSFEISYVNARSKTSTVACFALLLGLALLPARSTAEALPSDSRAPEPSETQTPEAAAFDALQEEAWVKVQEVFPGTQDRPERLADVSLQAAEEIGRWAAGFLERLDAIDPEAFRRAGDLDRFLGHRTLHWQLRHAVQGVEHFWLSFQVTPYAWSGLGVAGTLAQAPLATPEDRQLFLGLLGQSAELAETLAGNLDTQRRKGILLPRPEIPLVVATFAPLAAPPAEHPYRVRADDPRLAEVAEAEVEALRARADEVLEGRVIPAFAALVGRFDDAYRAAAPAAVGLGQYPGGEAAYRHLVRRYTTLDLSPEEIHRLGLAEVARIEAEMAELRELLGAREGQAEFHQRLRTDPRFLACDPAEVEARLMAPIERIEPLIGDWFGRLPEAPYGVARLDPGLEGALTYGHYRLPNPFEPRGLYYFNGSDLDQRSLVNAAALIYHELVPGHHFQLALQEENQDLHPLRRLSMPTAYIEGWGEYASALAHDMGLYSEPYDRYGRLAMDMFLSVRLVVDTGMNHLGWSRQEAMDYMKERVLESETQIATETLRYGVDIPGQALAYKTGALEIADLRRQAEEALGDAFDIRAFHDLVLGHGGMPLSVLEELVMGWVEDERAGEVGSGG